MRASRWLTAIAVLIGLAAMHGITASAASAAAPCGATVAHVHAATVAPASAETVGGTPSAVTPNPVDAGHAAMACLVILLAGLVLALTARRRAGSDTDAGSASVAVLPTHAGRGPPPRLISCVSRT